MNYKLDIIAITAATIISALLVVNDSPVLGFIFAFIVFASLPLYDK